MKKFYTDKDIEELFYNGVKSLRVDEDVVLTDLAFEKARKLELSLDDSAEPPAAPVRPYLSEVRSRRSASEVDSASSTSLRLPSGEGRGEGGRELVEKRIREKIAAKLGNQVDAALLDTIIKRTMKLVRAK